MTRDPRLTPARGDIAAAFLQGEVEAQRFVEGVAHQAAVGCAPILEQANQQARRETDLLFGEMFTVYDVKDGFAWGQSGVDDYIGYVEAAALTTPPLSSTHRVRVKHTTLLSAPDIKSALLQPLSRNAKLTIVSEEGAFARAARGGYVPLAHIETLRARADFVAVAEDYLGAPYLWGGRGAQGVDCSGLIQIALESAGIAAPRDTDMQEKTLGQAIAFDAALSGLRRGDFIFWDGHMGVMLDETRVLHANSHHMQVAAEPLLDVAARMMRTAGPITSIRRFA